MYFSKYVYHYNVLRIWHNSPLLIAGPANLPGFSDNFAEILDFGLFNVFSYLISNRGDDGGKKTESIQVI